MKKIKNIAIIAFESKKTDLIEWSYFNKELLIPHQISALGFAENILEGTLNKKINRCAGKLSSYHELSDFIKDEKIDAVIIFGEASEIFETKDVKALIEDAIQNNIIVAANRTTVDFVLHSSLINNEYSMHTSEKKIIQSDEILKAAKTYLLAKASENSISQSA
jgi:methylglyoxal synthase